MDAYYFEARLVRMKRSVYLASVLDSNLKIEKGDRNMATKTKSKNGHVVTSWQSASDLAEQGFKSLNNSEILRLREMPEGSVIDCTPVALIPSKNKAIRQPLIEAVLTEDGRTVTIPAQASIANQLIDEKTGKLKYEGQRVLIKKAGIRTSSKWKDDQGKARQFSIYEIAVQS